MEVNFGSYALPVVLTVLLAIIYKIAGNPDGTSTIPDRAKPVIAILLGIALGIAGMFYQGIKPAFKSIMDFALYGLMTGAAAVGLWEGFRATIHPAIEPPPATKSK